MMNAKETIIAWTPRSSKVEVGPLIFHGEKDWTDAYEMTSGAAFFWVRNADQYELMHFLKSEFIACVFRDGVEPQRAYVEFSKIKEFHESIPPDMPDIAVLYSDLYGKSPTYLDTLINGPLGPEGPLRNT